MSVPVINQFLPASIVSLLPTAALLASKEATRELIAILDVKGLPTRVRKDTDSDLSHGTAFSCPGASLSGMPSEGSFARLQ
jgi:hypothetical protein